MSALRKADIRRLFELLNDELRQVDTVGEVFLVGGAVMCLAYGSRASTRDADALFRSPEWVRKAAARSAIKAGIDTHGHALAQ